MSTTEKQKLPASGALGRRQSASPASPTTSRPATRSPTPNSSTSSLPNGGLARTRSLRGSALSRRPSIGPSSLSMSTAAAEAEQEARAETIAALEEVKEKLRQSEVRAEQLQKETEVLQARFVDATAEQAKLEDRLHEEAEVIEQLKNEKRDSARQMREMESIYEAERAAMNKEKEEMSNREEEMQSIIKRLKESLSQKNNEDDDSRSDGRSDSRNFRHSNNSSPRASPNVEGNQFAPPSSVNRSDSRNNSKLLLQKDRVIESLRLELAEAQIKIVESENQGGGRRQEVERQLLEARMNNARLMEDNESFQLLLQEKTLNGDFAKNDFGYMSSPARNDALDALEGRSPAPPSSSLADELSGFDGEDEEQFRRLEAELKASKEQNKALTLYINKIIERLLEHQGFEAILSQGNDFKPEPKPEQANAEKDLPPPPPPKDMAPPPATSSILQRAKSVVAGKPKPRPMSQMPAAHSALTDPETAPSIPFNLNRSASISRKQRPQSEINTSTGAFNVVNAMYKGSGNPTSPLHGPQTPRNSSFFAPRQSGENPNAAARAPSGSIGSGPPVGSYMGNRQSGVSESGSSNSAETSLSQATTHTGEVSTPPQNQSPPRPLETRTTFGGAKPRPLRLVQERDSASEEQKAREKADKRGTWFGWAMAGPQKKDDSTGGATTRQSMESQGTQAGKE